MKNATKLILITGPSAAGKTTLCSYLAASFKEEFEHIRQDDYLKDPKTFPDKGRFKDWDLPQNVQFDVIASHLVELKEGKEVAWHTFAKDETEPVYHYILKPKPYILLEGTMVLMDEIVANMADLKIYLDVPVKVSLDRRAHRALNDWGFDVSEYDREMMVPVLEKHRRVQKFNTDYIVDGTKPKREVANEVKSLVKKIIETNENKSSDSAYISGLWNQGNRPEPFSGDRQIP